MQKIVKLGHDPNTFLEYVLMKEYISLSILGGASDGSLAATHW